jgi:DNA replication protein DnaC
MEDDLYQFCSEYAKNPRRGRRLVIFGENGSGKSHAVKAINFWANRIAMQIPLVDAEAGIRLADSCLVAWPRIVDDFKNGQWDLEDLFNSALLIVDDIGAEHDPSRVGIEKLYLLLERRAQKWTILTTNISPANWETKFERRIADRLFRNCQHIDLSEVPSYSINT